MGQHPPTRRGIIVDVMVESGDKFVEFMGKTTKAKVSSELFVGLIPYRPDEAHARCWRALLANLFPRLFCFFLACLCASLLGGAKQLASCEERRLSVIRQGDKEDLAASNFDDDGLTPRPSTCGLTKTPPRT